MTRPGGEYKRSPGSKCLYHDNAVHPSNRANKINPQTTLDGELHNALKRMDKPRGLFSTGHFDHTW